MTSIYRQLLIVALLAGLCSAAVAQSGVSEKEAMSAGRVLKGRLQVHAFLSTCEKFFRDAGFDPGYFP